MALRLPKQHSENTFEHKLPPKTPKSDLGNNIRPPIKNFWYVDFKIAL